MILQKPVSFFAIINRRIPFLQMLDPVEACILNFGRKAFLNPTALDLISLTTKSMQFTNILLEYLGHELYTTNS
jgi:hypothetical protein